MAVQTTSAAASGARETAVAGTSNTRSARSRADQRTQTGRFGLRNIYILPTSEGWLVIATLGVLFLAAVNYGVQLIYMTVFGLGAATHAAMVLTHRNLHGMRTPRILVRPGFAGDSVVVTLNFAETDALTRPQLTATMRARRGRFWLRGEQLAEAQFSKPAGAGRVELHLPAPRRGHHSLPPLCLSTRYPLGLFRAWVIIHPQQHFWVYPKPASRVSMAPPRDLAAETIGGQTHCGGSDELYGLRRYREGDAPRHLAWAQFARGQPLMTRELTDSRTGVIALRLTDLNPGPRKEAALAMLTRRVLDAEAAAEPYALMLGNETIPAGLGTRHKRHCLERLAAA